MASYSVPAFARAPPLGKPVRGLVRGLRQPLDDLGELLEALVRLAVLAGRVAGVDPLEDDRQLPVAEGDEEVDLAQVPARALGVARTDVVALREAGRDRRRREQGHEAIALLGPVDEQ